MLISQVFCFYPAFVGSKTPPQNSAEAKKLGGAGLPKKPEGLIKVSLY